MYNSTPVLPSNSACVCTGTCARMCVYVVCHKCAELYISPLTHKKILYVSIDCSVQYLSYFELKGEQM